jgi:HlyD family type I secretion membrane fusion protein
MSESKKNRLKGFKIWLMKHWIILRSGMQNANKFLFAKTPEEARYTLEIAQELRQQVSKPLKFALLLLMIFFAVFIVWGGLAPLDNAAIAPGVIVVSDRQKTVQHLEGGVVEDVLVKDGDQVQEGQVMISLNRTQAQSRHHIITSQLRKFKATQRRLAAEINREEVINWDDPLFDLRDSEVQEIINLQQNLLASRRQDLEGRISILQQRIIQNEEQIKGLKMQKSALENQLGLLEDELQSSQKLLDQGLTRKTRYLELSRSKESIIGSIGDATAKIAGAYEQIAETKLQIMNLKDDFNNRINEEQKEVQAKINDLQAEFLSSKDILERTEIKAPSAGLVTELAQIGKGSVIRSGEILLKIIPENDKLIVEAKVLPKDIDSIYIGMKARVQLSAFKSRLVPRVDGKVIYVSADRIQNPQGMQEGLPYYYLARVEIDDDELANINYDVRLSPGMPADVFIVKGERTFLQYILGPIIDSFHKAFKES